MNHTEPLGPTIENHLAQCVADGTATPEEARQLLVEFVNQAKAGKVSARMIEHVSDCFAAFLAHERKLLPAPEAGRPGLTPVPVQTLEKAFGLIRATSGQPVIDRDTRCAVATEVLTRMLLGETLEVASEFVAAERRAGGLPISSETDVRAAWAKHKPDAYLWLQISRTRDDPAAAGWTPEEVQRLSAIYADTLGIVLPGERMFEGRHAIPGQEHSERVGDVTAYGTPENSKNKPA